ncbi:hypothetical protein [Sorangium sp. Soce836]|uniref:Uncharacterized protein n=1 Tax=Sorangium cellulosum TaxID=56 RepID=A0A4P2QJT0_SORCE|nr:hypothetical protein [Sorangium sp. Soce836]AUX30259.1 hypothetical protein SOCE836_023580 [Sorangium cellulosum]WCQ89651.1 hypothetical protein NQZ70_02342 [Sorangium sp. Soce836]
MEAAAAAVAVAAAGDACFEVLDALGLCRLTRRTGDLDGAVPLRVAKACVPLLEGNAFGHQITLALPIEVQRRLGSLRAEPAGEHREALLRAHRAALPRLVSQGFLAPDGAWHRALRGGVAWTCRTGLGPPRLRLWTGLLVRPDPGVWLRVAGAANRRNVLIEVSEAYLADERAFVPLVLELRVRDEAPRRLRIEGEIGCLAPVRPGGRIEACALADAPEVGRAHAEFYDARYFAVKKGEVTRKYRRLVGGEAGERKGRAGEGGAGEGSARAGDAGEGSARAGDAGEGSAGPARVRLVVAGPAAPEIAEVTEVTTAAGPDPVPWRGGARRLESLVVRNAVPFRATFDGHTLAVAPDAPRLAEGAAAVERAFAGVFGADFIAANRGALWYLTKYFTPHPPGEPHFFVKPWAFTRTPPGWSSLLDGVHGDGYDVLRGVVATDVFFATPAVFHVRRIGAPIEVPEGAPLLRVLPIPRDLLRAGFREARFLDA